MADEFFEALMEVDVPGPTSKTPPDKPAKAKRTKPANYSEPVTRLFERAGYHVALVERAIAQTRWNKDEGRAELTGTSKRDLWGFGDYLAVSRAGYGAVIVQVCAQAHITNRVRSACSNDAADLADNKRTGKKPVINANRVSVLTDWLLAGNRFLVIGFAKEKGRWVPTIVEVSLDVVRRVQDGERISVAKLPTIPTVAPVFK